MGVSTERSEAMVHGDPPEAAVRYGVGSWWRSWAHVVAWELRMHAPFTLLGTLGGLVLLTVLSVSGAPRSLSLLLFWTFHPLHVLLSALVTAGVFRLHRRAGWWRTLLVGYIGSVGIATLSDSVIPFVGECWLGFPHRAVHWGFVEKWWLVNPLAVAGALLAMWRPHTKFPHAGHVWLSTLASLFHMTVAAEAGLAWPTLIIVPVFLFLAVWVPCCTSDIVFPLLFASSQKIQHSNTPTHPCSSTPAFSPLAEGSENESTRAVITFSTRPSSPAT